MRSSRTLAGAGLAVTSLLNLFIFFSRDRFEYRSYQPPGTLYRTCDAACSSSWRRYVYDYPAGEIEKARNALAIPADPAGGTEQQIRQLGDSLLRRFSDQRGVPTTRLMSLSPYGQYQLLQSDSSERLWCGNWSNIFAWFAWSRGIVTRIIEIEKPGDHHVFNECFIPETNSWAMVDLTNSLILPRAPGGEFYTGYQYALSGPSSTARQSYFDTSYRWQYYRRYHLGSVYSTASRVRRYLLPTPWYDTLGVGEQQRGNALFRIKQGGIVLWLFFLTWFFISLANRKKHQASNT